MLGSSVGKFQIPDLNGVQPALGLTRQRPDGVIRARSEREPARAHAVRCAELAAFGRALRLQTSFTARYSSLTFAPDPLGDLLFTGIAQNAFKQNMAYALQSDAAYKLNDAHTLRAGVFLQTDHSISQTTSQVLLTDGAGAPLSDVPVPSSTTAPGPNGSRACICRMNGSCMPTSDGQLRPAIRQLHGLHQRQPGEPAGECGVAGAAGDHAACRLFALPVAAAVRAGRRRDHREVHQHHLAAAVARRDRRRCRSAPTTTMSACSRKSARRSPLGLDTYYKQSHNLIDEGQFGAPIILTPFNYRYGKQYGVEFTAQLHGRHLHRLSEPRGAERQGQGHRLGAVQLRARRIWPTSPTTTSIWITSSSTPPPAASSYRLERHALQRRLPGRLGPARRSGPAARRDDRLRRDRHSERRAPALLHAGQLRLEPRVPTSTAPGRSRRGLTSSTCFDKDYEIRNGTGVGVGAPQFGPRRGFFFGLSKSLCTAGPLIGRLYGVAAAGAGAR